MANLQKISRLTFIKQTVFGSKARGLYKCECGNIKECNISSVKTLHTTTCGCYGRPKKHGLIKHPLYAVWQGIKRRCYNKNCEDYPNYGGRGVIVCDEWKNEFKPFYDWCISNGWEKGLQIDKDIKGGMIYSPENCLVITSKENGNHVRTNRVLEYNGIKKNFNQWAEEMGINRATLKSRLNRGWNINIALTKPLRDINAPRK